MANAARDATMENGTTNIRELPNSMENKEQEKRNMESLGIPRVVQLKIKPKKKLEVKQDVEVVTAFYDSSEEDFSPPESYDEDSVTESSSDSDDEQDSSFRYVRNTKCFEKKDVHTFKQPRNQIDEAKVYAILRSQLPVNQRGDRIQNNVGIQQDRINAIMNLSEPEAEWEDIIALLLDEWDN